MKAGRGGGGFNMRGQDYTLNKHRCRVGGAGPFFTGQM